MITKLESLMRMFSAGMAMVFAVLVGSATTKASESSEWIRVGSVEEGCSFAADLDLLEGYPFARLRLEGGIVALVAADGEGCQRLSYQQVPTPREIPTYDVEKRDLCMGRLPTFWVTRSLSGVQERCKIVE